MLREKLMSGSHEDFEYVLEHSGQLVDELCSDRGDVNEWAEKLGVHQSVLSNARAGRRTLPRKTLHRLVRILSEQSTARDNYDIEVLDNYPEV